MGYFKLIRADGSSKRYSSMIKMLQDINKEDLETLWKLVKAKYENTRPEEDYESVLWGDLKVMFKPDIKSDVWRNLQGYKVTVWRLFDNCGVHFIQKMNIKFRGGLLGLKDFKMILRVTIAQLQLLSDYYCWKNYADTEGIKIVGRTRYLQDKIMSTSTHPIIVLFDSYIEDAFSSTNTPDYTPASPNYFPVSPGNTFSDPSEDLSKDLLASLAISPFYDDPYMKVMQTYNATNDESPIPPPQAPIAPPTILPPSPDVWLKTGELRIRGRPGTHVGRIKRCCKTALYWESEHFFANECV
ncbi:hypothetical protein Tco_0994408 [Tanacetum coccineum]